MTTPVGSTYVKIIPETKDFDRELRAGVEKPAVAASSRISSALKAAFSVAAIVQVGRIAKDALGAAISESSNLSESMNAVNVTFGSAAGGIAKLGREAASSLGLSNTEFNSLAVRFSSFASTVAGSGGDVAEVMDELTTRAADFASVMNLDVAQAAELFQSGLAGETEPLRQYGLDISAAAVETFAYANGIASAGQKLTEAQKVQARYGLIMEQTSKTAGDFANTSDQLANRQRILGAQFDNIQAKVGAGLLPVLSGLAGLVIDRVLPGFSAFGSVAGPAIGRVKDALVGLFELFVNGDFTGSLGRALGLEEDSAIVGALFAIREAAISAFGYFTDTVVPILQQVAGVIGEQLTPILSVLGGALGGVLLGAVISIATAIGGLLIGALVAVAGVLTSPIALIGALAAAVVYAYTQSETFRGILQTVAAFVTDTVVPAVLAFAGFLTGTVLPALLTVGGFLISTFTPTFQALQQFITGSVLPALQGLAVRVQENLPQFLAVAQVIGAFIAILAALVAKVLGEVLPILIRLAGFLVTTLLAAVGVVIGIFGGLVGAVQAVAPVVASVVGFFAAQIGRLVDIARGVVNIVVGVFTGDFGRIRDGVSQAVGGVLGLVGAMPGRIAGALGNLGGLLVGAGRELISGLISGITSRLGALRDQMSRVASTVKGFLPGSPVKEGPLVSWNNGGAGKRLMGLLTDGIVSGHGDVRQAIGDALDVAGMRVGGTGFVTDRLNATAFGQGGFSGGLSAEDRALLLAVATRPLSVQVDGREIALVTRDELVKTGRRNGGGVLGGLN